MPCPPDASLLARVKVFVSPQSEDAAQRGFDRALERDASGAFATLLVDARAKKLLRGVFAASPFLADVAARNPARLARLLQDDPDASLERLIAKAQRADAEKEADLMRELRLLKQEAALLIGLCDLAKVWDTMTATRALTLFADASLSAAVVFTLREAFLAGKLELFDQRAPARGSGWIFLGMGKQGAYELNYSSDIDLVVFFDRARARPTRRDEDIDLYVKLTQRVVKIMSERSMDGYVFRTDLRLRPDPGATPIALPLEAAYAYYESLGQNWERAAFIKARPVAGDLKAGEDFLADLAPFVWRKYFDFAAIADVHSIKRQIHAHKGHGEIAIYGHDVKLGRGGIREIEFFVQTQQLITGGRDARLRARATLDALDELAASGWIDARTRDELREAYLFLRDVEHRVQMIADEQTHRLPQDAAGLAVVAAMMGFASADDFSKALRFRLERVQGHYARLFESAPPLSLGAGDLVFTGDADDPPTLQTLRKLGFETPELVTETIRAWHFGRYRATRSQQARERLTELTPALLQALAATQSATQAFLAFDEFLRQLPAGVQLFSLIAHNPKLLDLLATIMGAAPKLAQTISRRPRILDALLEPAFFETTPSEAELGARLRDYLGEARSYEEELDRARIFGREQKFLIGVKTLVGALAPRDAGDSYAKLAEVMIAALLECVETQFAQTHGRIAGGAVAVVAMGKLGGREMTAASDLDLMLLYDADPLADSVGGERPLPAAQYFARLTQRLIAAISAQTAEGSLYEVDFRLRPSGNKGPIAVRLESFEDYQANEAWTWEHMALLRARVVAGAPQFAQRVAAAIRTALTRSRDEDKLRADVLSMRARLEREKGSRDIWNLKQVAGGQIDIEFITQYLLLLNANRAPQRLSTMTAEALERLASAGLLCESAMRTLIEASLFYQALTQILRLAIDKDFSKETASRGLVALLLRASGESDLDALEARLARTQAQVRALFTQLLGPL